ncbi:trypsin-like peptidase domain-containing protein [Diaminobutyricimonas sp. TR449]|uniref:trypsin-like peptidase domain-containing protein n=1 Tax=Diaminobutyricimonas sp. TR449 TaxID=2708076 RepID=UPI00141D9D64|nr:trypsin-like peptidase domain-containing protein [Diaminobutyricimonas sp. TR449]
MTNPTDNGDQPVAPDQPETPQPPAAPEPPATPEPPQPLDSQPVTPAPSAQPSTAAPTGTQPTTPIPPTSGGTQPTTPIPPSSAGTQPTTPIPPTADRPAPRYGQYAPAPAGVSAAAHPQGSGATPHHGGATPPGAGFGPAATGNGAPPTAGGPASEHGGPAASPRKKSTAVPVVAALAIGALIGGVSGAGVTLAATGGASDTRVVGNSDPGTITINNADTATNVGAVAAKASPSVVTLSVTGGQGSGTGSGVVIDDEGHILTNTHVVTLDGAVGEPTVKVQTYDGRLLEATVVGTDPISDLAVIKVDPSAELPAIKFADSDELNVGDTAIAIGAPLGLSNTVTDGIVSALNRSITVASSAAPETPSQDDQPDEDGESPFDFWNFDIPGQQEQQSAPSSSISLSVIQTDASINPGNSGGALLNANGELIGINVAIASAGGQEAAGSIGVGFSIPSNLAQRVADEIIATGSASHGLLGATVQAVSDGSVLGAEIRDVTADGAADKAGLQAGDVVTSFNGVPITSPTDLTAQVRVLGAGEEAEIVWVRDGETNSTEVTVGELPQ